MTFAAILGSVELGFIYAVMALGVFLSFRTLNTPDLTVDGSIITGAATSAMICSIGWSPILALGLAFVAGCLAGSITALMNTRLKIQPLLAGILVMLGLYSINLRIMGGKSNMALIKNDTIYKSFETVFPGKYSSLLLGLLILIIVTICLYLFLKTRLGFALRATGDNEDMVKASGINSNLMRLIGLAVSNGLVGLAGGMLVQYQSFVDVGMGVGMVVIGLASVIIGEAIFGTKSMGRRLIAVSLGAILYRLVIAFALQSGMPSNDLKLVSAVIVTIALSTGIMGEKLTFRKKPKESFSVRDKEKGGVKHA
ncbi:ABC transporter permease [Sinanaerobacter chloroacetimidivorans]|uniref:ABC transporter permease n=1 Tax=Sinanaerobacter chloroacetimidivorans TaxID=2818044 RepID=A0A8J8B417_9FIRM|nr:ABC transporter permease [Sinanaerobacter chloroacetimidivorans]MBR0598885.1 ABC transporter permease [Sinanaerobacter chloroacetimidivorans]